MKKKSKSLYGNVKTVLVNGEKYDSKKEAERGQFLNMLEKKGVITELKKQVKFAWTVTLSANDNIIQKKAWYVADFTYKRDGVDIVEDVKGYKTKVYLAKKKIMKQLYNIDILET